MLLIEIVPVVVTIPTVCVGKVMTDDGEVVPDLV